MAEEHLVLLKEHPDTSEKAKERGRTCSPTNKINSFTLMLLQAFVVHLSQALYSKIASRRKSGVPCPELSSAGIPILVNRL